MIPTIETIIEGLLAGKITKQQAIAWLHQHAESAGRDLRDDFAAAALSGYCSDADCQATHEQFAESAYRTADAMIDRRKQPMKESVKALRERLARLELIGYQMSNVLYNLKQRDSIPERERKIMGELVMKWDAARSPDTPTHAR